MSQGPEAQLRPKEKEPIQPGVKIHFSNLEVLRAFILDPQMSKRTSTLAERMSGIREILLGEFPLDGELFKSAAFTLVIEPDRNPRSKEGRPTAIIRADIQLGKLDSNLRKLQLSRASEKRKVDFDQLKKYENAFVEIPFLEKEGIAMVQWSRNTSRISNFLTRENFEKLPLVVLQIWDKDAGTGSISISLVSNGKYVKQWNEKFYVLEQKKADGWEIDEDEVDRWRFDQPVGADVHNAERFYEAIKFYEETFSRIMRSLYKAEEVDIPNLLYEIESPMIFGEHKEITFSDIGGQSDAIKKLRSRIATLKSRSNVEGINVPFLLYGAPGNGKTSLAQAAANELQAPLLVKTSKDLPPTAQDSDFLNLLEAGYWEAKAAAKVSGGKSVYCIEGVETLIGEGVRLQDRFLNLMDEWKRDSDNNVLVIATSNFPQNLHPGVISRFDAIPILQPNAGGRKDILEIHAKKINKVLGQDIFTNVDLDRVARRLDDFSGRDIERFLSTVYSLGRLESQEKGRKIEIDTEFVLKLVPDRRLGFKTS